MTYTRKATGLRPEKRQYFQRHEVTMRTLGGMRLHKLSHLKSHRFYSGISKTNRLSENQEGCLGTTGQSVTEFLKEDMSETNKYEKQICQKVFRGRRMPSRK